MGNENLHLSTGIYSKEGLINHLEEKLAMAEKVIEEMAIQVNIIDLTPARKYYNKYIGTIKRNIKKGNK